MAARKDKPEVPVSVPNTSVQLDRIAKLLALNLIKDQENQQEKIKTLTQVGFTAIEVASLLNTTSANIRQALYMSRKKKKKKLGGKKKTKKSS